MLASCLRFIVLRLIRLFYPRIEVDGRERIPTGPTIFVLNHPNGLLDPLILMTSTGRHAHFLAKSTLFANPIGLMMMRAFGALPVYRQRDAERSGGAQHDRVDRNEQTFAECRALLRRGLSMALFPEGTTHSHSTMLPLRTGAARIALSAEAEANWQLNLQVVPVGLWYENKARFRTSVLVVIGKPFTITEWAELYGTDPKLAVKQLTDRIDERLDAVVLQAESNDVLRGLRLLAAWTAPSEPETLEQQHQRTALLLTGYRQLQESDPERIAIIEQRARRYARILRTLGITDPWALELPDADRRRVVWLVLGLVLGFVPALLGFLLSYIGYRLAAPLTPLLLGKYEETTSTGKLIIGTVLVLVQWLIITLLVGWWFGAWVGLALFVLAPACGYIALRWGEWLHELREVASYNWLYLRHRALVDQLIERRRLLANDVLEALQASQALTRSTVAFHIQHQSEE